MNCNLYGTNSVAVALTAGAGFSFVLPGDRRRVSLALSSATSMTLQLTNRQAGLNGPAWAGCNPVIPTVFPYRDYGPLIQEEVWVSSSFGSGTVTFTEIYILGRL